MSERVIAFVLSECYEADPSFDYTTVRRRDAAIWTLVTEQPQHLLDPQYAHAGTSCCSRPSTRRSSRRCATAAATSAIDVWSEYNVTRVSPSAVGGHPVRRAAGSTCRRSRCPGDLYTPRVHWGAIGASERMIVSPGREAEGIMHMPTGQSGHPLSPFYANSHAAWVKGEPTPFLPGPAVHTLTLTP